MDKLFQGVYFFLCSTFIKSYRWSKFLFDTLFDAFSALRTMYKKELYVRKIYGKFIKGFMQLVRVFEPVSRTYFSYFNLRAKMNESL